MSAERGERRYRVTIVPLSDPVNPFNRWGWEVQTAEEGYPWAVIGGGYACFKNWAADRAIRVVEEQEREGKYHG